LRWLFCFVSLSLPSDSSMNRSASPSESRPVVLAVDVMGGDGTAKTRLAACRQFLKQRPEARLRAFVTRDFMAQVADGEADSRLQLVACDSAVGMNESPVHALRHGRDSTLACAIRDLKQHSSVCLSAGNTGALVAFARHFLTPLPGIQKPALAAFLPSPIDKTLFLDAGASVSADSEQLLQFGLMGSALMRSLGNKPKPAVALLNIGTESIKGNDTIWQADRLLQASRLNYRGYCEGTDLFAGQFDVIVTEGFVGNVALKSSEGMARFMLETGCWHTRIPFVRRFFHQVSRLNPARHNGAVLLGFDDLIVKSHGACDIKSYISALASAWELANRQVINELKIHLENLI